jgi:prepilin-type N-terminal cleavage/methylation domain-containing protein
MNILNAKSKYSKGFTFVEIVLVLAILAILISLIIPSFGKVGGSEALDTATMSVIAVLNEAKSQAISSKNASNYGVRIFYNKLVSFENSYGTLNKEITISNLVTISTSTGIGTDVIFSNVSGNTSASGTVTVTVLSDTSKKSTITIYSTGVIEKN